VSELVAATRAALAQGATAEQKAIGAQACRSILTALDVEPGKPLVLPDAPKPHPLSGITLDQALDLAIARLTMTANARDAPTVAQTNTMPPGPQLPQLPTQPERRGPQTPIVPPSAAKAPMAKRCVALVHRTTGPARAPTFDAAPRIGFCLRAEVNLRR